MSAPTPESSRPKLILVIDDDHHLRGVLKMLLTMNGFLVITAVDGKDALKQLEQKTPDLIITDLMMPGQGGYDFLRTLPSAGVGRIPVLILSGSGLDESTIELIQRESEASGFLKKPVEQQTLLDAIHRALNTAKT